MSDSRKETRTPVTIKVKFRSTGLDQFVERYSVDISRNGIFVRTKQPVPVGTRLRFECRQIDNVPLFAGEGTVVWTRPAGIDDFALAPGMGVRFDRLTGSSEATLEQILAAKRRRGDATLESRFDAGLRLATDEVSSALADAVGATAGSGAGRSSPWG